MVNLKVVDSLEKVFLKDKLEKFKEIQEIKAFKGERISFQIILKSIDYKKYSLDLKIKSELKNIRKYRVGYVPSEFPTYEERADENYITVEPGLFPDVLYPLEGKIDVYEYTNTTIWVTIDIPKRVESKKYNVKIELENEEIQIVREIEIDVCDVELPESDLIYTDWFHSDCIATYHNVKVFSEEYWKLVEKYMKLAKRTGVTQILTPIFTPPLDTEIGGERPTVQLVDIKYDNGEYTFKYGKFERWVRLAQKVGFKYFEMAHFFTQWGAKYTPKIIVKQNGRFIKKFGWHVKASSKEYKEFIDNFLPSLVQEIKKMGIENNVYFHISDEPAEKYDEGLKCYEKARSIVEKHLKEFKIIDALSNVEIYNRGIVDIPIPAIDRIEPFLEKQLKEKWCYYCCAQATDVSNRFFAMPSVRTRIIGVQLYLYNMIGFLQWGFNFYYSRLSKEPIDPYKTTDAKQGFPSGDSFIVYPYKNGATESIRSVVFYEALQDRMMLKLLEQKIGRKETEKEVQKIGGNITFKQYPHDKEFLYKLKNRVIEILTNK